METMNKHKDHQRVALYLLTGDPTVLPKDLRMERGKVKAWKLESPAPEDPKPQKRFKRSNPANPNMNEARAWAKEIPFESRSHMIEGIASNQNYIHIYNNQQSTFTGAYRESPCHRDMTEDERTGKVNPKIGPKTG